MSLDPNSGRRSTSPTSSGRASPVSRTWRTGEGDDTALKDKAFRRYAASVERTLSLFDTTLQDWPDYISFLGRLLKSLQSHPANIPIVPSKSLVAKRLSQCLNPSLPSGVHQKALEVYNYVFTMIGPSNLARDLPLYLPGVSTTLSFASLSVQSTFLTLFERHLLVLSASALRPATRAFILALLPGLEEETSEEFERTLALLDKFKYAIRPEERADVTDGDHGGDHYFWQCFFSASIASHGRRMGALAYLTRRLPKLGGALTNGSISEGAAQASTTQDDMVSTPEPGLLVRCFAAGLGDVQPLVQRGYLDLLVTHLPLHCYILQVRVKPEDLRFLMYAASGVVARKDMSLNRRLWTWLIGPEPLSHEEADGVASPSLLNGDASSSPTRYFERHGLKPLTQTLLQVINQDVSNPSERARPFRICLSLMDRWEIGGLVVPEIFLPMIDNVRRYLEVASDGDFSEALRSASVFFDGVESGLIWSEIAGLAHQALMSETLDTEKRFDKLALIKFILGNFNVREEEMLMDHAPLTALAVICMLADTDTKRMWLRPDATAPASIVTAAIDIFAELTQLVPDRAFAKKSTASKIKPHQSETKDGARKPLQKIMNFYQEAQGNLEISPLPVAHRELGDSILQQTITFMCTCLEAPGMIHEYSIIGNVFALMLSKMHKQKAFNAPHLLSTISSALLRTNRMPFPALQSTINVITSLRHHAHITPDDVSKLIEPLMALCWSYLESTDPKYHVETVRCIWQLQHALPHASHEIEAAICSIITRCNFRGPSSLREGDDARRFAILWTHTIQDNAHLDRRTTRPSSAGKSQSRGYEIMLARPTMLLLDSLEDEHSQLCVMVRGWLQNMIGVEKLLRMVIRPMLQHDLFYAVQQDSEKSITRTFTNDDDVDQCLYYFRNLSNILKWAAEHTWAILAQTLCSAATFQTFPKIVPEANEIPLLQFIAHLSLNALHNHRSNADKTLFPKADELHRAALTLLHQILTCSHSNAIMIPDLDEILIARLMLMLSQGDPQVQVVLLESISAVIKTNGGAQDAPSSPSMDHARPFKPETIPIRDRSSVNTDQNEANPSVNRTTPASLLKCLQAGFTSATSRLVLDSWITFLIDCLPLYAETIFQILIPLTGTFCTQIQLVFDDLSRSFSQADGAGRTTTAPESTLISLLNGLEHVLARGHERLLQEEARGFVPKTPDQPTGFFGNMVSGVFASETPQARSLSANSRLTVLLSFQDAVRICFTIWTWNGHDSSTQDVNSLASFTYTSLRMRNRARRLLEHLFAAEALECLETVVALWRTHITSTSGLPPRMVFQLLHVLDGSRPKHTMPAIFNALYSRTNPTAIEPARTSTMTSSINDMDLVLFLVEYARSLEDDAMDEIWADCMAFLKDLLGNPFPHRQTLHHLLEFAAILGEKVDNTNFGEQRKMRRELSDIFLRLLTAIFTTRPMAFAESNAPAAEKASARDASPRSDDVTTILAKIAPNLPKILVESDRVVSAVTTISTHVIGPTFKAKSFPETVSRACLVLLGEVSRLPGTQKFWKKDLGEAFNDNRFFGHPLSLVEGHWTSLLRLWAQSDKERMPELLARLTSPSAAGLVFGVGATSARMEADRKTQLNVRRITCLVLSMPGDTYVTDLPAIQEKVTELLTATNTSSPSSATRADVYMLLRALILKTSAVHLASLWAVINAELHAALSSVVAADHSPASDTYNNQGLLQACKLLDALLYIGCDDFQLHEWLFITDTIDAVYRPAELEPVALVDELSLQLGALASNSAAQHHSVTTPPPHKDRRPLLGAGGINAEGTWERRDELIGKVLRPFFAQLSIFAFESTYSMEPPDWDACKSAVLKDVFDDTTIIKAL